MTLVFDTSVIIGLEMNDKEIIGAIQQLLRKYELPPATTFLNLFEFLLGVKLKPPKNAKEALEFIRKFDILNSTERTSQILAELKYKYDRKGITLSLADLVVASLVIENGMVLVTMDKDFKNIEELNKEFV